MNKITVLLVDNHRMLSNAIASVLEDDGRFSVVGEAGTHQRALDLTIRKTPRVIVTAMSMVIDNDYSFTQTIRRVSPVSRIIWLANQVIPGYVKKMFGAGSSGMVTKNSSCKELVKAILVVDGGRKYICEEIKDSLSQKLLEEPVAFSGLSSLTTTELTIISCVREGLSSKEIAARQGVCLKTVEVHRYNILKKLKLKNTAALINYVNQQGL